MTSRVSPMVYVYINWDSRRTKHNRGLCVHGMHIYIYIIPNRVVSDSDASRNSVVEMALSLSGSMGTSVKFRLSRSKYVPPGG